ncbi:hypothetical protein BDV41DRAFT_542649 [Aspergillus transmontanensis]|uniref:NACHT-NTPase and P-loop NTPases N-terminal domain-containing protein n=1 Tax=Aspergillus transmontanensis TaxID=1034304 RepID=A0A5N6VSX4_9EURO|nr:hypothetical protein BDV41DRAFT_542649 [Aspergillus transmontanensis]
MNVVTAIASILAILKTLIATLSRLYDAYKRQKEQPTFLREYQDEPRDIKSVTQIFEDDEALQTEAIKAQILTIGTLSQNLHDYLRQLDPEHKSTPRRFPHQLIRGLKDEKNMTSPINQISRAKANLLLHVQVSGFKLTADY